VQDWRRIKAKLSRATAPAQDFSGVYYLLFGISGSALLSLIPLAVARGLPAWVTPLYLCFFVFSLLFALALVRLNKDVRASRQSAIAEILADIEEIDRTFAPDR
jgi:protein-S-isoprenylcysteine O-methyltransferase Ste14